MKKLLLAVFAFIVSVAAFAQSTKWKTDFSPRKVFIENKSQFDALNKTAGDAILFGSERNHCGLYFTKTGLTYRFDKTERKFNGEEEKYNSAKNKEEAEREVKTLTDVVRLTWLNANPNVEVIASEPSSDYFNYAVNDKPVSRVKGFNKLVYKNIYLGIDAEYVFHAQEGIKYSLIVHPGADVSQVKMKYTGASKVSSDAGGHVHLGTIFGDIVDHAPLTFYENADNASIESHFVQSGKTISFSVADYDKTKTIIIDPWTTTPVMPSTNIVWYVKADTAGNTYAYGGTSPISLQKFNSSGTLVWTYNTAWQGGNFSFGPLATDRTGTCYISNGGGCAITKISPAGAYIWSGVTPNGGFSAPSIEFWAMDFNCDQTVLYVGGSRHNLAFSLPPTFDFEGTIFKVNLTNGVASTYVNVVHPGSGAFAMNINEVRSLCASPNGNMYFLSLDTVGGITPALGIVHERLSTYHFPYYMPYSAGGGSDGQGQNNIRANSQFIYSTNGETLHKRDIANGLVLATVTIPNGAPNNNSGVAIDSCGNVYVGSQSKVVKYDANLNYLTEAAVPEAVYDLTISANGDVLACGHNFVVALDMGACAQIKPICYLTMLANASAVNANCGQCNGTATATPVSGTGPYTYLWSNSQTTQSINSLCAGPYTVTITDANQSTASASVTITQTGGAGSASISSPTSIMCAGDSAEICLSAPSASYLWSTGATTQCIFAHSAGNYYVTVTDNNGCTATSNHLPIQVYPLPPVSISVNGDTLKAGNAVTYQWYLNGNQIPGANSNVYVASQTGNYSLGITDTNGCAVMSNPTFVSPTSISEVINQNGVKIFPNPLDKGNWHLEVEKEWLGGDCRLFNAAGELVYKAEIKSLKSEIALTIARGIYLLELHVKDKTETIKLVKI